MGSSVVRVIRLQAMFQLLFLIYCTQGSLAVQQRSRYSTSDLVSKVHGSGQMKQHQYDTVIKHLEEKPDKRLVMGLRHRDHPKSPLRPQNATRQQLFEEATKREGARMARRRQRSIERGMLDPLGETETSLPTNTGDALSGRVSPGAQTSDFYVQMKVGIPPGEPQLLLLDTQSHLTWLQCSPCPADSCFNETTTLWDPATSSTYTPVLCDDDLCKGNFLPDIAPCVQAAAPFLNASQCAYSLAYHNYHDQAPGPHVSGVYGTDNLFLNGADYTEGENYLIATNALSNIIFGCAHSARGFTEGSGVLGLGYGNFTLHTQLNTSIFFCLPSVFAQPPQTGFLGFGSMQLPDGMTFTGMHYEGRHGYFVNMIGISVNGTLLNTSTSDFVTPGVLIDMGTTFTQLHPNLFNAFARAINDSAIGFKRSAHPRPFCYQFDGGSIPDTFPRVALHFDGGGVLNLTAQQVLTPIPVDDKSDYCLTFQNSTVGYTIIGNTQLAGILVELNPQTDIVGFAPYNCVVSDGEESLAR